MTDSWIIPLTKPPGRAGAPTLICPMPPDPGATGRALAVVTGIGARAPALVVRKETAGRFTESHQAGCLDLLSPQSRFLIPGRPWSRGGDCAVPVHGRVRLYAR